MPEAHLSKLPRCPVCQEAITDWLAVQDVREFPGEGLYTQTRIVPGSLRYFFKPCGHEYRGEIVFPEETA